MASTTLAQRERAALADLFDEIGPDQPTLCVGWDTGDLLHHLLCRERRPDALPGQYLAFFAPWTQRAMDGYDRKSWRDQVNLFRAGPPWYTPVRIPAVDAITNNGEFFIHHEDARRGRPGWTTRELDADTTAELVRQLTGLPSRLAVKPLGVGVRARLDDGREFELASGEPVVTLVGAPGELVLWISGRREACKIEIEGTPEAVRVMEAATRR